MAVDKQIEKQGSAPINTHRESLEPMGPVIGEGVEGRKGRGGEEESRRGASMWRQTSARFPRQVCAKRKQQYFSKC